MTYRNTPDFGVDQNQGGYTGQSGAVGAQQMYNPNSMIGQLQQSIMVNPGLAQSQFGYDQLLGGLMESGGIYDWQVGNLNQNANLQRLGLGLDQSALGVQQGALSRQLPLLNQQWGLTEQQYGLQQQGFDQATQQAWQGAQQSTRGLNSTETARGAFGSVGHNQGLGDIQQQLANSLSTIGRERKSADLSNQSASLNEQEQVAKLGDAQKQLDISSQRLGLSKEEITTRLTQAIDQLGLSTVTNATDLLSNIASMQQGQYSPFASMIGDIYAFTGLNLFSDGQSTTPAVGASNG